MKFIHHNNQINILDWSVIARVLLCVLLIVGVAWYNRDYLDFCNELQLNHVSYRIPQKMWHPETDEVYNNGDVMIIKDDHMNYIVYALCVERCDKGDAVYELIKDPDAFLKIDNIDQLIDCLIENNIVETVTDKNSIVFNSSKRLSVTGSGCGDYNDYSVYLIYFETENSHFVECLIYREPYVLYGREKKEMLRKIRFKQ